MNRELNELCRPWKLCVLALGVALLYIGERIWPAPDWTPATIWAMALVSYATAGWGMRVLIERRWRDWPLALFWAWLSVDGVYMLALWLSGDWHAVELMREANAPASAALWAMLGLALMPRCSLREMPAAFARLTRPAAAS